MRILYVSDVYFPRVNGVSTSIQTFRQELAALGHEITLIAPEYPAGAGTEDGVLRIPSRYLPFDPEDRFMRRGDINRRLPDLRAQGFDIVHVQTPFVAHYAGTAIARALEVPCVETYHTFFEEYLFHYVPFVPKAWMRRAARRFSRAQCNAVDGVVVPSTAMRDVLTGYGVTSRMDIIPTGLRLAEFADGDGARFRAQHGVPADRPVLVHIGRVAFEKNIGFVLDSVAVVKLRVPDVLLVIAGEGPAVPSLKRRAGELGLAQNVLFVGYLARGAALNDCYRSGDAFVFASRTETQGLVLLEAMALGVPVVSTAMMGTKDILAPARGARVVPEDVGAFADACCEVLQDRPLRERLGREGTACARDWAAPQMAQRMAEFYGSVIAQRALRPVGGRASEETAPWPDPSPSARPPPSR